MVNLGDYKDTWKRALELNRHYYGTLGRATVDYLKGLAAMLEAATDAGERDGRRPNVSEPSRRDDSVPRAGKPAPVLVLEAEAGETAIGIFMIENNLSHPVTARPQVSGFADGYDRRIEPRITFDPPELALSPGEQTLVRILTVIEPSLEPNIRYRGELTVQELPGTRIAIVIRRRDPTIGA
jgi:hypothetical protein